MTSQPSGSGQEQPEPRPRMAVQPRGDAPAGDGPVARAMAAARWRSSGR